MKIAYFTTAQDNAEYSKFSLLRNSNSNSSNQVFHSNFIRCLVLNNEIEVFSCRSDNTESHASKLMSENSINWNYLVVEKNKAFNLRAQIREIRQTKINSEVAFVDTMNVRCLLVARKYCLLKRIPLIGIVTDNPYNITGLSSFKAKILHKLGKKCDAYVCLTESLNSFYNVQGKPSTIINGFSKKPQSIASIDKKPYFFYAGTLMEKYGIYDLIDSFNKLDNPNINLIIAGHNKSKEFDTKISNNPNIEFLGNIPNSKVVEYENSSIANINPRPFMETLDKDSIPSKVIEYSSKNSLVISGTSTPLKRVFQDSIFWIDENNSLDELLKKVIDLDEKMRKSLIEKMNDISKDNFSLEANNKKINLFLQKVGEKHE